MYYLYTIILKRITMGLDMYLYKKSYVQQWPFESDEEKHHVTVKKGRKVLRHIKPNRVSYVIEQIGYWRKSNHIHNWFVQNIQKDVDDCREYNISSKQLEELLILCKSVIKTPDKGSEVLPTLDGFFFGSIGYDNQYINDLKDTVKMIERILADEKKYGFKGDYYYHSSW